MKFIDKDMYEKVRLLSGQTIEETKNFFEALTTIIVLNYLEKIPTIIPQLGSLSLKYEGDEELKDGIRAIVTPEILLDDYLLKNIGQVEDGVESDIEKKLKKKMSNSISEILGE